MVFSLAGLGTIFYNKLCCYFCVGNRYNPNWRPAVGRYSDNFPLW